MSALYDHYRNAAPGLLDLCLPSSVRVLGRAQLCLANHAFQYALGASSGPTEKSTLTAPAPASATGRLSGLRYLRTGNPQLERVIDKVGKVRGSDIPILIMGETGTGKELLAQAIHHDSPRTTGPFIAVNCASIPETLIESELFGYEDGAFTGVRKKGAIGKIVQANSGTLFLDEIGDMPLSLQARLLRVLQERMVTPLGSSQSLPTRIDLICATNHNLRERMAQGLFREDRYYRLNGLVVKLPPLRERTDLGVVKKILATEASGTRYTLAPELLRLFHRHQWPGNLHQPSNLLRTAIVMAGEELEIGVQHMPDDFLDDMETMPPGDNRAATNGPRPLSMVSAVAIRLRFCSMRSAIRFRRLARSAGEILPRASLAACAASNANSTSSVVERATSQKGKPMIGVTFGKYSTCDWRNKFSAYVIVIALLEGIGHAQFADVCKIPVVL